jgi:hypothetical protein
LDEEGEYIASDEYLCNEVDTDRGVFLAVDAADYTGEDHVDCRGEEGWGEEDENALDYEWH